jgi:hypothetical protein
MGDAELRERLRPLLEANNVRHWWELAELWLRSPLDAPGVIPDGVRTLLWVAVSDMQKIRASIVAELADE